MIRVPEVRLIDVDGAVLGVMSSAEALTLAENRGLDLVEVAATSKPPTCKIMDYGKFLYEQKKKAHEAKKKQSTVTVKELQIRPRTEEHDLNVKIKHAKRFLLDGDKVRFSLRFRGREIVHQDMGHKLLKRVMEALAEISIVESMPRLEGQQLFALIAPDKTKIDAFKKAHPEEFKKNSEHKAEADIIDNDDDSSDSED